VVYTAKQLDRIERDNFSSHRPFQPKDENLGKCSYFWRPRPRSTSLFAPLRLSSALQPGQLPECCHANRSSRVTVLRDNTACLSSARQPVKERFKITQVHTTTQLLSLQGTTTVSSIAILFLLARPLALPGRANLALNCLLGVSALQVK